MHGLRRGGLARALAAGWLGWACAVSPIHSQEVGRAPVVIDYVGVEGIYLPVGSDQGLAVGDTLMVYGDEASGAPLGMITVSAVGRRRSIAGPVGPPFDVVRGDVVFMRLPSAEAVQSVLVPPVAEPREPVTVAARRRGTDTSGPQLSGILSLSIDARETSTSWDGQLFGETRRIFASPVARLSLTVTELPGGVSVRTSLRGAYRYSDAAFGAPATSIRAYELVAVKSFERAPIELRLGRFHNPYEDYSGYWDGALVRVGGRRGGIGLAAGFEPARSDEAPSNSVGKVSGFADVALGGRGWRYDADLSLHRRHVAGVASRTSGGFSQHLSLGRLVLSQRMSASFPVDGARLRVEELRLRGAVRVVGPVMIHGGYARRRPLVLAAGFEPTGPRRTEVFMGGAVHTVNGSVTMDLGFSGREGSTRARSLTGSAHLRAGRLMFLASGQHGSGAGSKSFGISPGVGIGLGHLDLRSYYQHYRTETLARVIQSHTVALQGSLPIRAARLTVRAQRQWGRNQAGTGLQVRLWQSF